MNFVPKERSRQTINRLIDERQERRRKEKEEYRRKLKESNEHF